MSYQEGFNQSGGMYLFLLFFVLVAIAIYFINKQEREESYSYRTKGNVIYFDFTSKHKKKEENK